LNAPLDRPIRAGLHPFWFWNDRLADDEVRRQVAEMAAKGIRGFFIHPRQGLEVPYLSETFFEKVRVAVDEARRRGLDVHLYDEFPYPSGAAGGEAVLGKPEYHATRLVQETHDVEGGPVRQELPEGRVLEVRAFPLRDGAPVWDEGLDLKRHVGMLLSRNIYQEGRSLSDYNRKRYWAGQPRPVLEADLPQGRWRVFVSVQAEVRRHKYWGCYADVLNREAVEHFIKLTHERYRERFGKDFGTAIRSVFVDETAPNWSALLPAAFEREYGYDIRDRLHALQAPDHPEHHRVRADLHRLKYHLFCESFEKPYSAWCRRHGLAYAGEKPSLRMSQLAYMDIPGCDPGHTKAGAPMDLIGSTPRSNARIAASAAYFYGKQGALCECYHSLGWSGTLQDAKLIAEGLLLCGVRYLVPHGFFYSTHALRKHDAPPSFFWQMPYWPLFGELSRRIERILEQFEGTWIDADVLLVDPASGAPTADDLTAYGRIHRGLMARHVEYLVVDTDILEGGRIRDGRVHVRDVSARVVILPPMQVVEGPLERWLQRFERAGGAVIRCTSDPQAVGIWEPLARLVEPSLRLESGDGDVGRVWVARRASAGRRIWFLLNTGANAMELTISAPTNLREVPLGGAASGALEKSGRAYRRRIAPFESLLLEAADAPAHGTEPPRLTVRVAGTARLRPLNKNLLRMYEWRMSLLDGDGPRGASARVPAVPLANQLQRTGLKFAPDVRLFICGETLLSLPRLRVRYEYDFENAFSGPVELVMEPGSIVGEWRILVNEAEPLTETDFTPTDAHVRGSLGADVTSRLRRGTNRIRVEVATDRPDGGLLNALYLAGGFGVRLDPPSLVAPAENGAFEDHTRNGLPYYAGVLEYETTFRLTGVPEGDEVMIDLEYERPFREASEVSINGGPFEPAIWEPRCVRLPARRLEAGENTMRTRVYTSLIRSFEGEWFDVAAHRHRDVTDTPRPSSTDD